MVNTNSCTWQLKGILFWFSFGCFCQFIYQLQRSRKLAEGGIRAIVEAILNTQLALWKEKSIVQCFLTVGYITWKASQDTGCCTSTHHPAPLTVAAGYNVKEICKRNNLPHTHGKLRAFSFSKGHECHSYTIIILIFRYM